MVKQTVKKYFIPHPENEFKPHILRGRAVAVLGVIILLIFLGAVIQTLIVLNTDILAAILPGVLVDLTNNNRLSQNLQPVKISPVLAQAAQLKANDMSAKSYFAHYSPEGRSPWYWFTQVGYKFVYAGENLAVNFTDSAEVDTAWMNSPGHRANILNSHFNEIGIATARGTYQGRDTIFVVQLFGQPFPKVAGVVISNPPEEQAEPETELVAEDSTFVAVKNAQEVAAPEPEKTLGQLSYSSLLQRTAASPQTILKYLYMALGAFVLLALVLNIFIEINKQHPRHITYGVVLLILILALGYVYRAAILPQILVV